MFWGTLDLGADKQNQERDEQERDLTKENIIVFKCFSDMISKGAKKGYGFMYIYNFLGELSLEIPGKMIFETIDSWVILVTVQF